MSREVHVRSFRQQIALLRKAPLAHALEPSHSVRELS